MGRNRLRRCNLWAMFSKGIHRYVCRLASLSDTLTNPLQHAEITLPWALISVWSFDTMWAYPPKVTGAPILTQSDSSDTIHTCCLLPITHTMCTHTHTHTYMSTHSHTHEYTQSHTHTHTHTHIKTRSNTNHFHTSLAAMYSFAFEFNWYQSISIASGIS